MTGVGGAHNYGTVYRLTPSGSGYTETILYSFTGGSDGKNPGAGVIDVNGSLYGTSGGGGAYNYGTVFKLAPSGSGYDQSTFTVSKGEGMPKAPIRSLTEQGGHDLRLGRARRT